MKTRYQTVDSLFFFFVILQNLLSDTNHPCRALARLAPAAGGFLPGPPCRARFRLWRGRRGWGSPGRPPGASGAVPAPDTAEGDPEGARPAFPRQPAALPASCSRHWLQLCHAPPSPRATDTELHGCGSESPGSSTGSLINACNRSAELGGPSALVHPLVPPPQR